ncbi:MAG: beta-methylgalactoside transporter [Firmicutes bacterium]|nr:beta-methylgalactoside transporter [Bacillota bacterium]
MNVESPVDDNRKGTNIPVIGGIVSWWYSVVDRWKNFLTLSGREKGIVVREALLNKGLIIILLLLAVYTAFVNPTFVSLPSIVNIITQTSLALFMALGVAGIILLTGTDLSAGRIAAFLTIIIVSLMQVNKRLFPDMPNLPWIVPLLIVMIVGAAIGFINGFFVAKFRLHSFIVTLSMQFVLVSIILIYLGINNNNGQSLSNVDSAFQEIMQGGFMLSGVKIRWIIFYAIAMAIIMWFVWNKTKLGKNMYAVGSNPEAATVSGISVFWTTIIVFSMAGLLYAISAFASASYSGNAGASTATNSELYAIAACVIGGVSFSGGVGKISGVVLGVFMISMIQVSLQFLQSAGIVNSNMMSLILGLIVLLAVVLDIRKYLVKR